MSGDVVIRSEGLGKRFLIGHQAERVGYQTLRDAMVRSVRGFARSARDLAAGRPIIAGDTVEEFWALRGLDFEIKAGDVVGVIGRNGAGKSTLFKILSRITEPSEGRVTIKGRVASLLEVGTGFHPELTGRENIYLNGAILGMRRDEITRKFDEIVAFAAIEQFLDTPIKRYSSGMYVRLAFAVAAHLEPEILLVDEVLAVGDAAFQRKCLGKMQDVAGSGRTVFFVSHNLPSVVELTEKCLWLDRGRLKMSGPSREVASTFLANLHDSLNEGADLSNFRQTHRNAGHLDVKWVEVCGRAPGEAELGFQDRLVVDIGLDVHQTIVEGSFNVIIVNENLVTITALSSADTDFDFSPEAGTYTLRCDLGALHLMPGRYFVTLASGPKRGGPRWDLIENLPGFTVNVDGPVLSHWPDRPGMFLRSDSRWSYR